MRLTTVNLKRDYEFVREQGGFCGRVWRAERENGCNYVIISKTKEMFLNK